MRKKRIKEKERFRLIIIYYKRNEERGKKKTFQINRRKIFRKKIMVTNIVD